MTHLKKLASLLILFSGISFSCSQNEGGSKDVSYGFILKDSLQLDIPVEFQFISKKPSNGKFLCYSYINSTFYIIDVEGNTVLVFNKEGEGPGEYDSNIYQAGLFNDKLYIQDISNIHCYDLNGNHQWSKPYNNHHPVAAMGAIASELEFINDTVWINPLTDSGVVLWSKAMNKTNILDTLKIISLMNIQDTQQKSRVIDQIAFEKGSIYKGELIYPNFLPIYDKMEPNEILLALPYEQKLYHYDFNGDNLKLEIFDLNLKQFKEPKGANEDEIIDPINNVIPKISGLNSMILKMFSLKDDNTFILYQTGIPDRYSAQENIFAYFNENKLLGALVNRGNTISSGIEIPWNKFEFMKPSQVMFLGNSKWLILQQNLSEKDSYTAYIYELSNNNYQAL